MDRRRFMKVALAAAGSALAAPTLWALATASQNEAGPPAIAYGRDRCDACGMIIDDPRYAAAARHGSDVHRYDDIGCLARHSGRALAAARASGFVHDATSERWIPAPRAWYVRSRAIRTPMNYGVAAFAHAGDARSTHPGAAVLSLDAALAALVTEPS